MKNNTVKTVQRAADQHMQSALNGWLTAMANAVKEPVKAMQNFWLGHGSRDLEKADFETHRVSLFNDKLDGCHSCIAPDAFASDDDEEAIEASIGHFRQLAAECVQYADDLESILQRRF